MNRLFRYLLVATVLISGFLLMNYVQHRYDEADLHKAVEAVRNAHPGAASSPALGALLAHKYAVSEKQISWQTELESKWRGTVLVSARITGVSEPLTWRVDLVRQSVIPISTAARQLAALPDPSGNPAE